MRKLVLEKLLQNPVTEMAPSVSRMRSLPSKRLRHMAPSGCVK